MRYAVFLLPITLAGCAILPERAAMPKPAFSPMTFFLGDTLGEGSLKIATRRARVVHVAGHGEMAADGTLVLVQHVRQGHAADRVRTWRIHPVDAGHYAGTLSDAVGPVIIEAQGDTLHIAYRAKGGLRIEQSLVLNPDGQSAANHMVVRKLGARIAVLHETIVRQ